MNNPDDQELSDLIQRYATRHQASPALESAIHMEIALLSAATHKQVPAPRWHWPSWVLASAGFACGIVATVLVVFFTSHFSGEHSIEAELIHSHIRSLMVNHLTDIATADQHKVKPWFQGKLDYSPPVKDLTTAGFPLVGGRLDYVAGRTVAALIYKRRSHLINVFVWPTAQETPPSLSAHQGYNIVRWRSASMQYCAVSDLNANELQELGNLLQTAVSAH